MISIDKGLLGRGQLGDVIERHREYGKFVERLDIIVFSKAGFSEYEVSDRVKAYPTNSSGRSKYFFDALRISRELFKKNKYDLIITQEPFLTGLVGVKLKKSFGGKLLVHFHGDYRGLKLLFAKLFVLPKVDAIRVMSRGQKDILIKNRIKPSLINVISTPVNLEKFINYENKNPEHQERILSLNNTQKSKKIILMVGRKDEVKDFNTLFKAITLVYEKDKNIGLRLVGNYEPAEAESLSLPEGLKNDGGVFISGRIDSNDLPAYYKTSYLVVLSSKSESFGKVLIEANACGKPVISTATTGAKEIIRDGYNGYLAPIGDAKALADKILFLLNNPEKAKKMGENGQSLVAENYSGNSDKITNLWREIIESK